MAEPALIDDTTLLQEIYTQVIGLEAPTLSPEDVPKHHWDKIRIGQVNFKEGKTVPNEVVVKQLDFILLSPDV